MGVFFDSQCIILAAEDCCVVEVQGKEREKEETEIFERKETPKYK